MTQGYLVMTAVIMAWQLSNFEEWTGWCLLVSLALYDLCAVLTPCGPLKLLVSLMQEEGAEPMPGLLFEAELPNEEKIAPSFPSDNSSPLYQGGVEKLADQDFQKSVSKFEDGDPENEKTTIKLGLGDFVFYSVLVSKAAGSGFIPWVCCFMVILFGLGSTLGLLSVYHMALPALPISIALGVFFYFASVFLIVPFVEAAVSASIFF
eukprot:CAMPEP_0171613510 /NCGR_PEP_ID=MMETSP0990-20121206/11809_1 /TAXON_ID=483369 /ORGANISM="non described non described, Strain CCMP2098" /LENGTH=206 /DNA_ID=CAMNT_0012177367 /DNA_START=94 /DNA_END=714 /DNA_ORIENTATION=+